MINLPPPAGELGNSAIICPRVILAPQGVASGVDSMSLMYAEKTLTLKSAEPATRSTLLGCQSREVMVDLIGFLMCLDTHQSFSDSKQQTEMRRAPDPTANLFSLGDHFTHEAARLIRSKTNVGFHFLSSPCVQTYALRSTAQVTMRLVLGAQSMPITRKSCWLSTSSNFQSEPLRWYMCTS